MGGSVTRFWKRRDEDVLGDELRGQRPEPPAGHLQSVVDRIGAERRRAGGGSLRPALAGAFTAVLLISFAVFGGAGYASSVAHQMSKVASVVKVAKGDDHAKSASHGTQASSSKSSAHENNGSHSQGNGNGNGGGRGDDNHGNKHDDNDDADEDQYRPGKGCGDKNHVHDRHDECKGHGHGHDD
jgi:hypothetical protein